jgi:hypothetical protein
MEGIQKNEQNGWGNSPSYSPHRLDLAPLDRPLFELIKDWIRGQHCVTIEAGHEALCHLKYAETGFHHKIIILLEQFWR